LFRSGWWSGEQSAPCPTPENTRLLGYGQSDGDRRGRDGRKEERCSAGRTAQFAARSVLHRHRSASLGVAGIYRSRAGDKKASLYSRALAAISPARFGRRGFFCIEIWKSTPRRACRTLRRARDEGIRGIIRSSTIADGRGTSVRRSRGLLPSTRRHIHWVERHMLSANSRYVRSEPPFLFKRQGGMAYPLC
jgi:hypothetical protein